MIEAEQTVYEALKIEFNAKNNASEQDFDSWLKNAVAQILTDPSVSTNEMIDLYQRVATKLLPYSYSHLLEKLNTTIK